MAFKILVVDDEELALSTAKHTLKDESDLEVHTASDANAALAMVKAAPGDYAVRLVRSTSDNSLRAARIEFCNMKELTVSPK